MSVDKEYFSSARYAEVSFKKYSQYWWSNRFYARLAKKHGPPSGRVLEVGCGLGHLLTWLTDDYEVFGGDINEYAIEEAKKNVPEGIFNLLDAEDLLIFPDKHFNILIAKHVVEHLKNPSIAIAEMSRVLAPGGLLIMACPNMDSPMRERKKENWVGYQDPTHISLLAPAEWLDILHKNNLNEIKVFSDGFWDPPYVSRVPKIIQRIYYGLPGGLQAIFGGSFIPLHRGESMIVLAERDN